MSYPSDLTTEQFALIADLFPKKKVTKPRKYSVYEMFNAVLYVLITGCQWEMLPNDLPNWKTVHHYFLTWSKEEVFDVILKKTLKNGDYSKAKNNIQLYSLQTLNLPRTQIGQVKNKQDLMVVKR